MNLRRHGLRVATWSATAAILAVLAANPALALGTPAGTVITNQATVDYTDVNGNALSAVSNPVTTTVSQVGGVLVDPDGASGADPGETVYYAHRVTNTGNDSDTIELSTSSGQGWTVTLYLDVDADGLYTSGVDTPLTDTNASGGPDTGALVADAWIDIIVAIDVPAGTTDGTSDTTVVTGTSVFDGAQSDTATDVTTIAAPTLAVVKSVAPAGPQPPGTVLTYTVIVTNNGTGQADAVVVTDPVPANTTYQAGSITLDGAGRTDAGDADGADYNVTTAGAVTVTVGTLASGGGSATVTFQVQID